MALDNIEFEKFKQTLKKASEELGSKELVFFSEWTYLLPGQSLEINGESLPHKYDIPTGWDGYGVDDLDKLEKMGFLIKTFESDEDPISFEKTIKYQITEDNVTNPIPPKKTIKMLEYEFYKSETGKHLFAFKGEFEELNELGSCSSEYLIEIIKSLKKVRSGELAEYDFGFEVYIIESKKETSLIIDTYDQWKCIGEVSTEEIYDAIKKLKIYLDDHAHLALDKQDLKSNLESHNYIFFDGLKLHKVTHQYHDWLSSEDYAIWSNSYVELNNKRIYIIKENVKVLSTFRFYSKEELESLSSKYNLQIREVDGIYYSGTETYNTEHFQISENDDLIVIYCTRGSYAPESFFIYGVYEK